MHFTPNIRQRIATAVEFLDNQTTPSEEILGYDELQELREMLPAEDDKVLEELYVAFGAVERVYFRVLRSYSSDQEEQRRLLARDTGMTVEQASEVISAMQLRWAVRNHMAHPLQEEAFATVLGNAELLRLPGNEDFGLFVQFVRAFTQLSLAFSTPTTGSSFQPRLLRMVCAEQQTESTNWWRRYRLKAWMVVVFVALLLRININ